MRTFYDPGTILMVVQIASAGMGLLSSFSAASAAKAQGEQDALQREREAIQEEVANAREQRDLKVEKRRKLARSRAALSAQGAELTGQNPISFLSLEAAAFAMRSRRLAEDSRLRAESLRSGATFARQQGQQESQQLIFGGIAKAGIGVTSVLSRRTPTKTTPKSGFQL